MNTGGNQIKNTKLSKYYRKTLNDQKKQENQQTIQLAYTYIVLK